MSEYKTLTCAEVSVGDKLPSLDIDITTKQLRWPPACPTYS